jgi:hypothetical protein
VEYDVLDHKCGDETQRWWALIGHLRDDVWMKMEEMACRSHGGDARDGACIKMNEGSLNRVIMLGQTLGEDMKEKALNKTPFLFTFTLKPTAVSVS